MDPKLTAALHSILKELRSAEAAWPFLAPVDWKGLCLDDYPLVVTEPMDLRTIGRKLKGKQYKTPAQFWRDVDLIWSNCKIFNSETAEVFRLALEMENLAQGLRASFEDAQNIADAPLDSPSATPCLGNPPVDVSPSLPAPAPLQVTATPSDLTATPALPSALVAFADAFSKLNPRIAATVIMFLSERAPHCFHPVVAEQQEEKGSTGTTSEVVSPPETSTPQKPLAAGSAVSAVVPPTQNIVRSSSLLEFDVGRLYTTSLDLFNQAHGLVNTFLAETARLSPTDTPPVSSPLRS